MATNCDSCSNASTPIISLSFSRICEHYDPRKMIIVKNIDPFVGEKNLVSLFEIYDQVNFVWIFHNVNGFPQGRAVVLFASENGPQLAMKSLRGQAINGKSLLVEFVSLTPRYGHYKHVYDVVVDRILVESKRVVLVENLLRGITSDRIKSEFIAFGPIQDVTLVPYNEKTVYCFITYKFHKSALVASSCANGFLVNDRPVGTSLLIEMEDEYPTALETGYYFMQLKDIGMTRAELLAMRKKSLAAMNVGRCESFESYLPRLPKPITAPRPKTTESSK